MRPFLARFWPYGPLLVTAAAAMRYTTWPWIAGLAACGLTAWAWELERRADVLAYRWGNQADQRSLAAGQEAAARLSTGMAAGHPERLTGRLSDKQELRWDFIVAGYVDDAPEPVYPQDGGER